MRTLVNIGILCLSSCILLKTHSLESADKKLQSITLGEYDSIVYVVKNTDNILQLKVARNSLGVPTVGGVTGESDHLQDFSIPIVYNNFDDYNIYNIRIFSEHGQSDICDQLQIIPSKSKIYIIPNKLNLKTATNCKFNLQNLEGNYLASFSILLNYTFKEWLNESHNNTQAHETALVLSEEFDQNDIANIKALNLPAKNIEDISPITGFYNLKILNLSKNNIKSLQWGIFNNFEDLNWLWLHDNRIEVLPLGIFDKLTHLDFLTLNDNDIFYLPFGLFQKLENLELLELSNNFLKKFPTDIIGLKKLISFGISSNFISQIPGNVFTDMERLTYVSLADNRLSTLPENIFNNLFHLKIIDLSNNEINNLPVKTLLDIISKENYNLVNNPIVSYLMSD